MENEKEKDAIKEGQENPAEQETASAPNPKDGEKKKRKFSISALFYDNRFVMAFSVFCAVIVWTIISATTYVEKELTISDVPVDYSTTLSENVREELGLQIVGNRVEKVTVKISGNAFIVGQITAGDILVTARLYNVTTAGTYSVNLIAQPKNNKSFSIDWIDPPIVQLKLDRTVEKEFSVELETNSYQVDDGFAASESLSLQKIVISGPEANVKRVAKVVAETDQVEEKVDKTTNYMAKIVLYDDMGLIIEDPELTLSATEAELTITIKEVRELPILVEFDNLPAGFNTNAVTLTPKTLKIAAPSDVFDSLTEILVGTVDFSEVDTSHKVFTLPIALPSGCINQSEQDEVTVKVNLTGMRTREFDVTNITVAGSREGQDINIMTRTVKVRVTGPAEEIELLTSDNISALMSLDDIPQTTGKHEIPMTIRVAGGDSCWAYGKPTAFVYVSDKKE